MAPKSPLVLVIVLAAVSATTARTDHMPGASQLGRATDDGVAAIVRPSMLAAEVEELAGRHVKVPHAKVVGVFEPRVFVIETAGDIRYPVGFHRDRVVVLIHPGALRVAPDLLVGSTVTVFGIARTLLGARVSNEVPWPDALDPKLVQRLEIRAALAATSVQTPDGIELTDNGTVQPR